MTVATITRGTPRLFSDIFAPVAGFATGIAGVDGFAHPVSTGVISARRIAAWWNGGLASGTNAPVVKLLDASLATVSTYTCPALVAGQWWTIWQAVKDPTRFLMASSQTPRGAIGTSFTGVVLHSFHYDAATDQLVGDTTATIDSSSITTTGSAPTAWAPFESAVVSGVTTPNAREDGWRQPSAYVGVHGAYAANGEWWVVLEAKGTVSHYVGCPAGPDTFTATTAFLLIGKLTATGVGPFSATAAQSTGTVPVGPAPMASDGGLFSFPTAGDTAITLLWELDADHVGLWFLPRADPGLLTANGDGTFALTGDTRGFRSDWSFAYPPTPQSWVGAIDATTLTFDGAVAPDAFGWRFHHTTTAGRALILNETHGDAYDQAPDGTILAHVTGTTAAAVTAGGNASPRTATDYLLSTASPMSLRTRPTATPFATEVEFGVDGTGGQLLRVLDVARGRYLHYGADPAVGASLEVDSLPVANLQTVRKRQRDDGLQRGSVVARTARNGATSRQESLRVGVRNTYS
jgi:hypothetical protein